MAVTPRPFVVSAVEVPPTKSVCVPLEFVTMPPLPAVPGEGLLRVPSTWLPLPFRSYTAPGETERVSPAGTAEVAPSRTTPAVTFIAFVVVTPTPVERVTVLPVTARTVTPPGMPLPLTVIPFVMPAVLATITVFDPAMVDPPTITEPPKVRTVPASVAVLPGFESTSMPVPALVRETFAPLMTPVMVVTFCKSGTVIVCAMPPARATGPARTTPLPASAVPLPTSGPKVAFAVMFNALAMVRSVPSLRSAVPSAMVSAPVPIGPLVTVPDVGVLFAPRMMLPPFRLTPVVNVLALARTTEPVPAFTNAPVGESRIGSVSPTGDAPETVMVLFGRASVEVVPEIVGVNDRLSFTTVSPLVSVSVPLVPSVTVGFAFPPLSLNVRLASVFAPIRFSVPLPLMVTFPAAAICCGFVTIVTTVPPVDPLIVRFPGITMAPANPARFSVP